MAVHTSGYTSQTLNCLVPSIGAAPSLWMYYTPDAVSTIDDSGYFSDGKSRGLKVGDVIICVIGNNILTPTSTEFDPNDTITSVSLVCVVSVSAAGVVLASVVN
jgi:hypothetical protein